MTDYRRIMRLLLAERSYRDVVAEVGCSHREVAKVKKAIDEHGVSASDVVLDDVLAAWFPDRRRVADEYEQPDFDGVLAAQKAAKHFTLVQAWRRYADAASGEKKYGYSQFCALYADYVNRNDLVAVLHHEPGRAMFVDWAGDTITLVDQATGEVSKAYLFVAVLPYSGLIFCRAFLDMKMPAWLDAHMGAFAFFAGVPQIVVPDNALTATHRPSKGDRARVITARYQEMADHYGVAIVPAGVRKPRHKAAVESAVNVVNTRVIGYLETDQWATVDELGAAITERIHEVNHVMRRKDGTTRFERYEAEELEHLANLPDTRFEEVEWKVLKVQRNYHVTADSQHYSVPYHLAGRQVRVRLTAARVTVFDADDIVCTHARKTGRKGQYSTLPEHVPAQHGHIDGLYSREWFIHRAGSFGPATVAVIGQVLDRHAIEAQGYNDCQNILSTLGKKNKARLEAACQELVNRGGYPTYTTIKRIMAAIVSDQKVPRRPRPAPTTKKRTSRNELASDVFVRDPSHYELPGIGEA